ncbi:membrane protein [Thioclava dalianensis]|uniref:Membrane protein n=1 Tax=Thioclava dalianensis TaxID=1185766 RepID=A0A074TMY6_9RHOB|nr:autotransporter assembly complex family protein [Thioclava dalianensis]KEP70338.1 membrane protein [Thioclava dalianensis]SFN33104.1 translocation and assembly module TamA [Thioclava dalianensis]
MSSKHFKQLTLGMALGAVSAWPVSAYDLTFNTPGASKSLRDSITGASLLESSSSDKSKDAQEIFAAARADYNRIVSTLFSEGYYSGVVSIKLDGREAASISPLDAPSSIKNVVVSVTPGPDFHFSRASIGPVAPKSDLPEGFATGKVAKSGVIVQAVSSAVSGWRDDGHAKAKVADQSIVADHRKDTIAADIRMAPGPLVHFGTLDVSGNTRLRTKRLREIAGFPTGKVFDPKELDQMQARLRRTGIFSSVAVTEAPTLGPDNSMDVGLAVVEQKKRKIGVGAEINSDDGLGLNASWLHRNLFGGGERFTIDGAVSGIGGSTGGGLDYSLGTRLERPATFNPDTSAYLEAQAARKDQEDYTQNGFNIGFGVSRIFNDKLTADTAIKYGWSKVTDDAGTTFFRQVFFPTTVTYDARNDDLDPTNGYYLRGGLTPFIGVGGDTGTGAQITGDIRGYKGFGTDDRFVLAGRVQLGKVVGSNLDETPRDYLFYSGGGGTVRGQPYESLGVQVLNGGTLSTGGLEFVGVSGEARIGVTKSIGVVAFYDYGYVSGGGESGSQAGAGLGLRYKTGIGPIRLDVGLPVSGDTGSGAQVYIGIGQAF